MTLLQDIGIPFLVCLQTQVVGKWFYVYRAVLCGHHEGALSARQEKNTRVNLTIMACCRIYQLHLLQSTEEMRNMSFIIFCYCMYRRCADTVCTPSIHAAHNHLSIHDHRTTFWGSPIYIYNVPPYDFFLHLYQICLLLLKYYAKYTC